MAHALRFLVAVALGVSGCTGTPVPEAPVTVTETAPPWTAPPLRPPNEVIGTPRASSFAGAARFPEATFTNDDLLRNFMSIALRAEAADDVDSSGNIAISKWVTPVRYALEGAKPADISRVAAITTRLRFLTGIDIAPATVERPNVRLSFVPFRTRSWAVGRLSRSASLGPSVGQMVQRWHSTEREKCLGLISIDPSTGAIAGAEILIKDELPPQIRDACIVEEIAQSLGLMNDDARARPSIFNDSQEYLDLTSHDEYLLRILYDPRVRPGMTRRYVWPLVDQIIREVRPAGTRTRGRA